MYRVIGQTAKSRVEVCTGELEVVLRLAQGAAGYLSMTVHMPSQTPYAELAGLRKIYPDVQFAFVH